MPITGKTTVEEAVKKSKEAAQVFTKYGLNCPGCRGAAEDTIEKVAVNNGLELAALLKELNAAAERRDAGR
jgi:hybrid cluster-associated redox disulfide protein